MIIDIDRFCDQNIILHHICMMTIVIYKVIELFIIIEPRAAKAILSAYESELEWICFL